MRIPQPAVLSPLLAAVIAACGCAAPGGNRGTGAAGRAEWERFVQVVTRLRSADKTSRMSAREQLGLRSYKWGYRGYLGIATEPIGRARRAPFLPVRTVDDHLLACAGDVTGDSAREYLLGLSWFGPLGGLIFVYDGRLRKAAEIASGHALGIELRDLTSDGKQEVIVWGDGHPGTGMFYRTVTVFKADASGSFRRIFEATTYSQNGPPETTERRVVAFSQSKGHSAVIVVATAERADRYEWSPAKFKFVRKGR